MNQVREAEARARTASEESSIRVEYTGGYSFALEDAVQSEVPFVTEAARHLLHAGGKRFRPLLVLLAAECGDPDADGVVTAACVVELTHLASLYHDDVMDEAALRRGADSANAPWDNQIGTAHV